DLEPARARPGIDVVPTLPLHRLEARLDRLGIDAAGYAGRTGLALVAEPAWLAFAGSDRFGRPLWMHVDAARAWRNLGDAALRDGSVLASTSGYRSHGYQRGAVGRKRARGQDLEDIRTVNAAPGYSEH